MPDQTHAKRRHPFSKTQYRVRNWHEYDRALQERGSLTLWVTPEAIGPARTVSFLLESSD